jgi:hypothetical protein
MSIKRILILTLTAGGGHIQAAKAKYLETKAAHPNGIILERDILFDWIWKYFGLFAKHLWGDAQARGNIFLLVCLSFALRLADFLFWVPFFLSALKTCLRYDIEKIIDTQPLGTSAIIKALRVIKWKTGKQISYEKVITDLPTIDAKHFFGGIKSLSSNDRPFLKVVTTKPILEFGETEEEFWKNNCNIPLSSIIYANFPLRPAFFEKTTQPDEPFELNISILSPDDLHLTYKTVSYGSVPVKRAKNQICIPIEPNDKVALMMLGANPNPKAVLSYTSRFIKALQNKSLPNRKDLFFIFCSSQVSIKPNIRKQILNLIQDTKNYPSQLTIVPISNQNDLIIAPLLKRSNATLTRSGGLTSMELLAVSQGKIWIHKEPAPQKIPKFIPRMETFKQGMPPWERGNARYLEIKKGAKIITPETFDEVSKDYFPIFQEEHLHEEIQNPLSSPSAKGPTAKSL